MEHQKDMNTKEHLEKIKAKCQEYIEFYGKAKTFPTIPDCLLQSAEAGWLVTITSIDLIFALPDFMDATTSELAETIAAAWPEELLN